ncbi:hypothetical protein [Pseudomonas segetis]|uniref:Uncharacterized protein n=1 Tax=Pseudomonas segetis TaxID=298908 RepID=A0A239C8M8_9PSED|nr:hypothetical protein [Pseudomonas segetis]SNS16460.1 hypothetical protein SAMN05216255_1567 [Pseudomonas segetis]
MSKENGGPAFPIAGGQKVLCGNDVRIKLPHSGMTLRDYFAAKALTVLSGTHTPEDLATWDYHHFAEFSYRVADAMLAERDK